MNPNPYADADIIVVDDEPTVVRFLSQALCWAGYKPPREFTDPLEAADYLRSADPDLVTLDISMQGLDGYGLLDLLAQKADSDIILPVLAISAFGTFEARDRAIKAGAKDFLVKPIEVQDLLLHVYALLDTRARERRLKENCGALEETVKNRNTELKRAQLETVERLARVAEMHDELTGKHTYRIARLSALLALEMRLSPEEAELIMRAAPLHDLGKVAINDAVLMKQEALSPDERKLMQDHALLGARILSGARSEILRLAEIISTSHHERWDGQGYPNGLQGADTPLAARIVAVADAFDALTHPRPYHDARTVEDAVAEIERGKGTQFDPEIVDALTRLIHTLPDLVDVPAEPATSL